jgi:hypothetical protein
VVGRANRVRSPGPECESKGRQSACYAPAVVRYSLLILVFAVVAQARPTGPAAFCETYSQAPACEGGLPACTYCHTIPPSRNPFGAQISEALGFDGDDAAFAVALPEGLAAVETKDADGDGAANLAEILAGSLPAVASSTPRVACDDCGWNAGLAFKRVMLDVCGRSPSWDEWTAFSEKDDQAAEVHTALDRCLDSLWWLGKDGVVWGLAHAKIRPIQAVKAGENSGPIPLGDYDNDYRIFVYTQTDDRDARQVLLADHHVAYDVLLGYQAILSGPGEQVQTARRAGLLTTRWALLSKTMFTGMPRTAAAHAYRAFLGLDIARMQGLDPVEDEPVDYDQKGVTAPTCAQCHSTLDPLTYPFTRYRGLERNQSYYDPERLDDFAFEGPRMRDTPEAGIIFGEQVANLNEWAEVAANSDAFAQATVTDYWKLMVGHEPLPTEAAEFNALWKDFRGTHDYRIEAMLHGLVETEAYGAP